MIGSSAATINILSLSAGFYFLYQLAIDKVWLCQRLLTKLFEDVKQSFTSWKGITTEVINAYGTSGVKAKLRTFLKFFLILLPILVQGLDSVLDALYFIKLKTDLRIIQVHPYVQVAQAFLLFTCKYKQKTCFTSLKLLRNISAIRTF